MRKLFLIAAIGVALFARDADKDHKNHAAHEHGKATLNVAAEDSNVNAILESPLANFISFESEPKTQAEKDEFAKMEAAMKNGDFFVFPAAAKCKLGEASVNADFGDHGDLEASFDFVCENPDKLSGMKVELFKIFPNLGEIEASIVTKAKGQKAAKLTAKKNEIKF
ncbi:MAG: DUF2796 domain-containing protein [Helicobacteraceae bacterium]|jgi:hypothetical protein|nr:DUF2796 domain-containing protein [Helicobacteraceae bacterium]